MTKRVKQFIEENIETIELARWEELFDTWYDETLEVLNWEDVDEISELFKVLETLNVTKETTSADRKAVIEKHVEEIVNDIQHNNYNRTYAWHVKWDRILYELNSHLGFTHSELFDILSEIDIDGATPVKEDACFVIEGL